MRNKNYFRTSSEVHSLDTCIRFGVGNMKKKCSWEEFLFKKKIFEHVS